MFPCFTSPRRSWPHAHVEVGLGCLDVKVQVVAEAHEELRGMIQLLGLQFAVVKMSSSNSLSLSLSLSSRVRARARAYERASEVGASPRQAMMREDADSCVLDVRLENGEGHEAHDGPGTRQRRTFFKTVSADKEENRRVLFAASCVS